MEKFKKGDVIVYLGKDADRTRVVMEFKSGRYRLASGRGKTPITLGQYYVEDLYELKEVVESPLYKALKEGDEEV